MNEHLYYLTIDLACITVPLLASFHPRIQFYRVWVPFFQGMVLVSGCFILWDILFTIFDIWAFNPRFLTGIYWADLPLEEWLFFFCVPYACVFTFHCLETLKTPQIPIGIARPFTYAASVILIFVAVTHLRLLYTSVTFSLSGALLLYAALKKAPFLPNFYAAFLLNLIPFFLANGVLTGSWLPEPIVYYNNKFNLGIRLGTIPVEDVIYGMLFQLGIIAWMKRNRTALILIEHTK